MPEGSGRTGRPGNANVKKSCNIRTPKPSMLNNVGGGNLSQGQVFNRGKVPGRQKGKYQR